MSLSNSLVGVTRFFLSGVVLWEGCVSTEGMQVFVKSTDCETVNESMFEKEVEAQFWRWKSVDGFPNKSKWKLKKQTIGDGKETALNDDLIIDTIPCCHMSIATPIYHTSGIASRYGSEWTGWVAPFGVRESFNWLRLSVWLLLALSTFCRDHRSDLKKCEETRACRLKHVQ